MSNYVRNFMVATNRASKITGISAEEIRANYRDVNHAPKGVKRAAILAHRIMDSYAKSAVAAETEQA